MKADIILYNGHIYKSNTGREYAEAVAIKERTFICVGSFDDCIRYKSDKTEIIDLQGRLVIPGLIDGHTHPETIAKSRWRVQIPEFDNIEDLLCWVADYCKKHTAEEVPYFFGEGYSALLFDENGPHKELLDKYVSDRPVRLQDFTDHACWYNSKALELMGIDRDTPETGIAPFYIRNENSEPKGWVKEPLPTDTAEEKMYDAIGWHPPTEVTEETVKPFLDFLKDKGVIAILDGITEGEDAIKLFYNMDIEGKLNMYYEGTCLLEEYGKLDECIATVREWQQKYTNEHVRLHTVKLFLDNTNEMGNSASLEPLYNDKAGKNYGEMNMSEEELTEVLLRLNEEKLDLHIHVVCDRGFRTACNAYEAAKNHTLEQGKAWDIFMELAHCELVHPEDMKRPAELGILINWTPHWAGGYFGEAAIEYLGQERWNTMYDFTGMIKTGATVTYSSDVIGENEEYRADPYFGMEISATRVDLSHPLNPDKYPGSVRPPINARLTVEQMIDGYTRAGAVPFRMSDKIGTIEEGKYANLAVLNKNIFEISADEIHMVKAELVMFEGEFIKK